MKTLIISDINGVIDCYERSTKFGCLRVAHAARDCYGHNDGFKMTIVGGGENENEQNY